MDRRTVLRGALAGAAGAAVAGMSPARASTYGRRARIPRPTAALVTRWDTDPWSRGAYSALPPGVPPRVRRVLADAVLGGRIVLAGEYASPTRPSTTTGAHDSGRHAAALVTSSAQPTSVIVIGAGLAGATAASALAAGGVTVTVVEARDRTGGRIRTDRGWGVPVELGASWVHGLRANSIVPLARASGLTLRPTDYEDAVARDTVTGRPSRTAEQRWVEIDGLMEELGAAGGPVDEDVARWLRRRGWGRDRFDAWAEQVEVVQEYGRDADRLGVRATQEGDDYRGGDAMVVGGYSRLVADLLDGIDVRLSTAVESVAAERDAVEVRTTAGAVLRADAAVVAVPLALLRTGSIAVRPLPPAISTALTSLRTGDLEKVVLRYDTAWWGDRQVIGVVGGGAPGAPAGSLAALRWTEFYSLTEVIGVPALMGLAGGSSARRRPASDSACIAEAVAALDAAFAGR